MYLFDAQNRWGYEGMYNFEQTLKVYLFDAQNRWGYELRCGAKASRTLYMYLFDAQNRWGYESV